AAARGGSGRRHRGRGEPGEKGGAPDGKVEGWRPSPGRERGPPRSSGSSARRNRVDARGGACRRRTRLGPPNGAGGGHRRAVRPRRAPEVPSTVSRSSSYYLRRGQSGWIAKVVKSVRSTRSTSARIALGQPAAVTVSLSRPHLPRHGHGGKRWLLAAVGSPVR